MMVPASDEKFYDILFVGDPRFPGGTSTALAAEIRATHSAGLTAAFKPLLTPLLRQARTYHAGLSDELTKAGTPIVGPLQQVACRFAVLHHPMVFEMLPAEPLRIDAEHAVLVLHHPPRDGHGVKSYEVEEIIETLGVSIGCSPWLAPVGPSVRAQLWASNARLLPSDWHSVIDVNDWPDQSGRIGDPLSGRFRVGRHSRPHPPKWPETLNEALAIYPDLPWLSVSMLGADHAALARKYGAVPGHWQLMEFGSVPVKDYLSGLDAWVYFHDPEWVEAFGRAILEAAACGLPVIVPPHFRELFGRACIYAEAGEVVDVLDDLRDNRQARALQGRRARDHVERKFGPQGYVARYEAVDRNWARTRKGSSATPPVAPFIGRHSAPPVGASRVLFMSSNGVGLGHLTRLLAVAEARSEATQPVFFTLSRGAGLVRAAGFPCEYTPFHRGLGVRGDAWNANLAQSLSEAADFHGVGAFVFDGNVPYQGVLDFLSARPEVRSVWLRRGFWRPEHSDALKRGASFDMVIEPGDIASALDTGPTAHDTASNLVRVPPIWRVCDGEVKVRSDSLKSLGLEPDEDHVLVSLGSSSNFDFGRLPEAIFRAVIAQGRVPVLLRSPLQRTPLRGDLPKRVREIRCYPIGPYLNAFDYAASTAGYNSFHEFMAAGLPTVWVPNEAGEMDRQDLRAKYASISGAGETLRVGQDMRVESVLSRLGDPRGRDRMRHRCLQLTPKNGSLDAALLVIQLACMTALRA